MYTQYLLQQIKSCIPIKTKIAITAIEAPDSLWNILDIQELLFFDLGIDFNPACEETNKALIEFFNAEQARQVAENMSMSA